MTDYQAARKRVEADIAGRHRRGYCSCIIGHSDLRLLLAGPPEPSVEEVMGAANASVMAHMHPTKGPVWSMNAKAFIQALYRSKTND